MVLFNVLLKALFSFSSAISTCNNKLLVHSYSNGETNNMLNKNMDANACSLLSTCRLLLTFVPVALPWCHHQFILMRDMQIYVGI